MTIKNLKIRVKTPEESEKAQRALFKLGIIWTWEGMEISNTEKPFLCVGYSYILDGKAIFCGENEDKFNKYPVVEMSVEELENFANNF